MTVLSFFIVFTSSARAQTYSPIEIVVLNVKLDSTSITHDPNQTVQKIVQGTVTYPDPYSWGKVQYKISITAAAHWSAITKIDGKPVQDGDIIEMASGQTRALEVAVTPNSDAVDTDDYCVSFIHSFGTAGRLCLSLITTKPTAAITSDVSTPTVTISPNPAGNYITVHGLNNLQAGYQYEIFSISGVEVRQGMIPPDCRINVQDLPSGAYRLLLFDTKRTISNTAFTIVR